MWSQCHFFFNERAPAEIYTLSLHDALPILASSLRLSGIDAGYGSVRVLEDVSLRSEEHTSELQSPMYLVCRLLLEKKKRTACSPLSCPSPQHRTNRLRFPRPSTYGQSQHRD